MATATQMNVPLVHRKEWQMMTKAPTASAAGSFVVTDAAENTGNLALYVVSSTVQYIYHHDEDAFVQIPSLALAGTFGAGSCGTRSRWSNTLTASAAGTTTELSTTASITGLAIGKKIRFLTGTSAGYESTVTGVLIVPGGTSKIQFSAIGASVGSGDTFIISSGTFYIMNGGTLAAGAFKSYDPLTGVATSLSITGAPASLGTDAKLVSTPSDDIFATGTALGTQSTTTLQNTGKAWTTNQWANYQIRITAGTGFGQVRTIASNTGTTITVSSAWTVTPDGTSQYEITGNDDFIYLLGNNAVTMYRYSRSGNSWTTLSPSVARGGAPGTGMSANWVGKTGDSNWATENTILDGRYIYSFRAGGGALLDRYDIALNTWAAITYINNGETFTTGSGFAAFGRYIFIRKDATHRYFKYSIRGNYMEPLSTNEYPDSTAVLGDKLWIKNYMKNGTPEITWIYSLRNTGTEVHRLMLI